MTTIALASFENAKHESTALGFGSEGCCRATICRTYSGALVGESQAELLVCQPGEAFGYVGMDYFEGALDGRAGTFVYQHGQMHDQGGIRPFGFVVTGSGTGELAGLRGDLLISVSSEGVHQVKLEYAFES